MIVGFPPFFSHKDDISMTINKIKNSEPPLELINSDPLRDFLQQLLQKNPKKRLGYKKSD
jgi:serine/threonine protein kinase